MSNVEEQAMRMLARSGIRRAPVPVESIARAAGLDVRYAPTTDDVSGALIQQGGAAIIAVNSAHHDNRQRFTIAHELGHFILHKRAKPFFDDDFSIDFRNAVSSEASERREIEANGFAAALLMPKDFLRKDMLRLSLEGSDEPELIVQSLAVRYKVSRRAMELRLANLGYISPAG
jgi:Zn-dependent peptidase ImmA (M78 family)